MSASKVVSVLLILLAIVIGISAVILCVFAVHQDPILVAPPKETAALAAELMDAVTRGDFQAVSSRMEGMPDLGVDREPEDTVGKLLWAEFLKTFTYEIKGQPYAAEPGMAVDMEVTYLDFNSVIGTLGDRVGALLKEKAQAAENPSEVYDEDNNYRQELVDQAIGQAAQSAIAEDGKTVTRALTLRMVYEQGQWWVVPDGELISVISGGTAQ